MSDIGYFVMVIGVLTIITTIVFSIMILLSYFALKVKEYRRKKTIKKRFDKPPLAKCYCVDCKYWNKQNGDCYSMVGYRTADNWFCWGAEPYKEKQDG